MNGGVFHADVGALEVCVRNEFRVLEVCERLDAEIEKLTRKLAGPDARQECGHVAAAVSGGRGGATDGRGSRDHVYLW